MKQYKNKEWLYQKYILEEKSIYQIADLCKCDAMTIWKWLKKFEIPRRSQTEAIKGKKNPRWKGGKYKDERGYISILRPNHPHANKAGYIYKHILIAEKALGRFLKKGEVVHHINENPSDNRNCNLLICTQGYHVRLHCYMRLRRKR